MLKIVKSKGWYKGGLFVHVTPLFEIREQLINVNFIIRETFHREKRRWSVWMDSCQHYQGRVEQSFKN